MNSPQVLVRFRRLNKSPCLIKIGLTLRRSITLSGNRTGLYKLMIFENKSLYLSLSKKSIILILCMCGFFCMHMHYYNSWDFKNYHWYNAYSFLNHRLNFDIAPAQLQTYFNPLLDTFNYLAVKALVYPFLYEFFFGALTAGIPICFLIKITGRLFVFQHKSSYFLAVACAVFIGASDPIFISQIGLAFSDEETLIFVLISLYCGLRLIDAITFKQALYFSGLMGASIGLAMGLKLTTSPYLLAIVVAFWLYKKPTLESLKLFGF